LFGARVELGGTGVQQAVAGRELCRAVTDLPGAAGQRTRPVLDLGDPAVHLLGAVLHLRRATGQLAGAGGQCRDPRLQPGFGRGALAVQPCLELADAARDGRRAGGHGRTGLLHHHQPVAVRLGAGVVGLSTGDDLVQARLQR
jgi:hypothetical protein